MASVLESTMRLFIWLSRHFSEVTVGIDFLRKTASIICNYNNEIDDFRTSCGIRSNSCIRGIFSKQNIKSSKTVRLTPQITVDLNEMT